MIERLKELVARRRKLALLNDDTASREAAELDAALPLLIAVVEAAERVVSPEARGSRYYDVQLECELNKLRAALKAVADQLGNTPDVAKQAYIQSVKEEG